MPKIRRRFGHDLWLLCFTSCDTYSFFIIFFCRVSLYKESGLHLFQRLFLVSPFWSVLNVTGPQPIPSEQIRTQIRLLIGDSWPTKDTKRRNPFYETRVEVSISPAQRITFVNSVVRLKRSNPRVLKPTGLSRRLFEPCDRIGSQT